MDLCEIGCPLPDHYLDLSLVRVGVKQFFPHCVSSVFQGIVVWMWSHRT